MEGIIMREVISLAVYGTLKSQYGNHRRFCGNAIKIEPVMLCGKLYNLPAGFPALQVPKENILAHRSNSIIADAQAQQEISKGKVEFSICEGWHRVFGELITFANPERDLPPIDRLEGVAIGFYDRVLVPAQKEYGTVISAWVYIMHKLPAGAQFLPTGIWPPNVAFGSNGRSAAATSPNSLQTEK